MILVKCKFSNSFLLIFSNICCRYTLELPLWGNSMCTYNIRLFNKCVFHHKLFKANSQPLSFIQRNEHVEMNNFSCCLSCTWMTIIDCLFYASDSLSWDISWEYIAKNASCVVVMSIPKSWNQTHNFQHEPERVQQKVQAGMCIHCT